MSSELDSNLLQQILDTIDGLSKKMDTILKIVEVPNNKQKTKSLAKNSNTTSTVDSTPNIKPTTQEPSEEEITRDRQKFDELYEQWLIDQEKIRAEFDTWQIRDLRRFAQSNNINVTNKTSKYRCLQMISTRFIEKRQLEQS